MGFDALLKRYFPVLVCLFIGVAAFFQARGMGHLVAGAVAVDPSSLPPAPPPPRKSFVATTPNADHARSAAAILSRNPFDSTTGPLDGTDVDLAVPTPAATPDHTKNPFEDPPCDSAKVLLITEADDPAWSFAIMQGSDGKSSLRRQGDEIGSHHVWFISWNRVWLTSGSNRCQVLLGSKQPIAKSSPSTPAKPPVEDATSKSRGKKVPPEIASKIQKVSDTEFNVERSAVEHILENQAELMKSARIVPEKEGDKIVGIRLFGIRPDSLLGTLGMENGDRLQSINGFDMSSPEKALEAYARLRSADHLTVTVNRRGANKNLDFNIK